LVDLITKSTVTVNDLDIEGDVSTSSRVPAESKTQGISTALWDAVGESRSLVLLGRLELLGI
jgi:hypothetical protein